MRKGLKEGYEAVPNEEKGKLCERVFNFWVLPADRTAKL